MGTQPSVEVAGTTTVHWEAAGLDSAELPPSPAESSDEDPFGHLYCGLDDVSAPVCGYTTRSVPFDLTVPAERAIADGSMRQASTEPCNDQSAGPKDELSTRRVHNSHRLKRAAHVVWCSLCGRSAIERIGRGLIAPCRGVAEGAYPKRISRLKSGLRPLSGLPLHNDSFVQFL